MKYFQEQRVNKKGGYRETPAFLLGFTPQRYYRLMRFVSYQVLKYKNRYIRFLKAFGGRWQTDRDAMECFNGMQNRQDHMLGHQMQAHLSFLEKRLIVVGLITHHNLMTSQANGMDINSSDTCRNCREEGISETLEVCSASVRRPGASQPKGLLLNFERMSRCPFFSEQLCGRI